MDSLIIIIESLEYTSITGKICESVGGVASVNPTINPSYVLSIVTSLASAGMPMGTNGSSGAITPGSPTPTILPFTGEAMQIVYSVWAISFTVLVVGSTLLHGWL